GVHPQLERTWTEAECDRTRVRNARALFVANDRAIPIATDDGGRFQLPVRSLGASELATLRRDPVVRLVGNGDGASLELRSTLLPRVESPATARLGRIFAVFPIAFATASRLSPRDIESLNELFHTSLNARGLRLVPASQVRRLLLAQKAESYRACYDEACQI